MTKVAFTFDSDRALAAVTYLASRAESVTELDKLKLAKLVFLADKYHLVRYGRPITGDFYKALFKGPIPQNLLDLIHTILDPEDAKKRGAKVSAETLQRLTSAVKIDRSFAHPRLSADTPILMESLSKSEKGALDEIIKRFGTKSGPELSALTHTMAAYKKAWNSRKGAKYAIMAFEDFFEDDPDAIAGTYEGMIEDYLMRRSYPASVKAAVATSVK